VQTKGSIPFNDAGKEIRLFNKYKKDARACASTAMEKMKVEQNTPYPIMSTPPDCLAKARGFAVAKSTNIPLPAKELRNVARTHAYIDHTLLQMTQLDKSQHEEPGNSLQYTKREISEAQLKLDKSRKALETTLPWFDEDYEGVNLCHITKGPDGTENPDVREA
jgi:hypothetical protein